VLLAYSGLELDARRLFPNPAVHIVLADDGGDDTLALSAAGRLQAMGYENLRVHKEGDQGCASAVKILWGASRDSLPNAEDYPPKI